MSWRKNRTGSWRLEDRAGRKSGPKREIGRVGDSRKRGECRERFGGDWEELKAGKPGLKKKNSKIGRFEQLDQGEGLQ